MLEPPWLAAGAAVFVAAIIQTATGAGLGLIAGPALLIAMGSSDAVHVAVVLNLVLSVALLPTEHRAVPRAHLGWLSVGALVGLPLGVLLLRTADLTTLKLLAGAAVTAGGIQIVVGTRHGVRASGPRAMSGYGAVAGLMTAALAIPGPAALLGLARTDLTPPAVRATLRAFFVIAYTCALILHSLAGLHWPMVVRGSLWMAPFLVLGALAGLITRGRIPDRHLRRFLLVLLLAMGVALLLDSIRTLLG